MRNTDHRKFEVNKKEIDPFEVNKKETETKEFDDPPEIKEPDEIDATIAHFKLNDELEIVGLYDKPPDPFAGTTKTEADTDQDDDDDDSNHSIVIEEPEKLNDKKEIEKQQWSFDISNIQHKGEVHFIFVAVSCVDVNDMEGPNGDHDDDDGYLKYIRNLFNKTKPGGEDIEAGTSGAKKISIIYRLILKKEPTNANDRMEESEKEKNEKYTLVSVAYCFYSDSVSGICRFIEDFDDDESISSEKKNNSYIEKEKRLKRFIILNFRGIHSFEYNDYFDSDYFNFYFKEKFNYPKSFRDELDYWFRERNCMKRLLACVYDKYFLATLYKNDVQLLEGKRNFFCK